MVNGEVQRVAPRLQFGGAHLKDPATQWLPDIAARGVTGLLWGALAALVAGGLLTGTIA